MDKNRMICKSAAIMNKEVTADDLKKINKYALCPLTTENVFTFKVIVGDNELDDRKFEPFNLNALKDLRKLYVGLPIIKDHNRTVDGQVARIYDTELVYDEGKVTGAGEPFAKLIVYCYMPITASNADLIAEIKAGIKKEVSTSSIAKRVICSICGKDNTKQHCNHFWGREYPKDDGSMGICYVTLDGAKEAYELSFVAVPAQRRAGTVKNYAGDPVEEKDFIKDDPDEKAKKIVNEAEEITARIKVSEAFNFLLKEKES